MKFKFKVKYEEIIEAESFEMAWYKLIDKIPKNSTVEMPTIIK